MKLSIFGLGYVGCVSAACFADRGHEVIGVDVNPLKVQIINDGKSPIVEPGIADLIARAVEQKKLRATTDAGEAVAATDVSLVCIGTPGNHNGSLDLSYIKRACQQIGEALAQKGRYHIVAMRSTMLPGTIEQTVIPTLEIFSGKQAGRDFGVAVNPEFLREGSSIYDFTHPPFTLIGADDEETSLPLQRLYAGTEAAMITVGVKEAEMVKYACNSFHALKVAFANEIGNVSKALGVDSHVVMDVFCKDTKLNLSPYYLKPGFAFGGSCLPKDIRAITYKAKELDVEVPLLNSILLSNRQQIERAIDTVLRTGYKNVGVLGLSFKPGTDDLRESPMVTLIETLIGKGLKLTIYDRDVELARLFGANKQYIEREIPHISSLMNSDLSSVIEGSEVVIIGKKEDEFRVLADKLNNGRVIVDLVRLFEVADARKQYKGICW
ncbi:MAG TPA: UDP-glucose/GDP-mannose dehydrogenase family protein [Blastocatellia bacterium]|nr:UDP-glucose/GDP-mannose dehydrogenase family protein [Blastocatellia bacterium]